MFGGIDVALKQISRTTLADGVIGHLEELIGSGEWPVGSRVPPEPALVTALGVSRNTVREAVRALVHTGLLEARPGDGTYVRAASPLPAALQRLARRWDALDALEVRQMLEREGAVLAATRRTASDVAAIEAALARRTEAADAGDRDGYVEADLAFHRAVIAAAHNTVLTTLYGDLTGPLRASIAEVLAYDPDFDQREQHQALSRAIADRDPGAAQRAAEIQLDAARAALADDGPR
jgi:DNA-binding FadR family transcriptional regulator